MNFFDIITLVALVWAVVAGWRSGFVSQLLSLVGVVLGAVISVKYGAVIGSMLGIDARFAMAAGFLIAFVATLIVVTVVAKLLSKLLSFVGLGWVNTLLGILFSIIKGIIVLALIYISIEALNNELHLIEPEYFAKSYSFDVVRSMAQPLFDYFESAKSVIVENV